MRRKLLLILFPLVGLLIALSLLPYQVDDAYISYRYAANIAQGLGPVYNPEDAPVEGFTSPLWVLMLSLGATVFGKEALPWIGTILGLSVYLALLILLLLSHQEDPLPVRLLVSGLLALWPGMVFYAATGMEMLLLPLCVLCVHGAASGQLSRRMGVIAAILAVWIRPEAVWLLVSLGLAALIADGPRRLFSKKNFHIHLGLAVGGLSLMFLRWMVFREALPNTYYAKMPSMTEGIIYLRDFVFSWAGGLLLILALVGGLWGNLKHRGFLVAGLTWLAAPVLAGGDWMPHYRFFLPAVLLLILSAGGAASMRRFFVRLSVYGLGVVLLCLVFLQNVNMIHQARISYDALSVRERTVAEWVSEQRIATIASVDIGMLGFYSSAYIVDVVGLTDPVVARSPGGHLNKQFNLDYLFDKHRPDVIILRSTIPPVIENKQLKRCRPGSVIEARIFEDKRLITNYRLIMSLEIKDMSRQSKLFFIHRDHPLCHITYNS